MSEWACTNTAWLGQLHIFCNTIVLVSHLLAPAYIPPWSASCRAMSPCTSPSHWAWLWEPGLFQGRTTGSENRRFSTDRVLPCGMCFESDNYKRSCFIITLPVGEPVPGSVGVELRRYWDVSPTLWPSNLSIRRSQRGARMTPRQHLGSFMCWRQGQTRDST